uniref:Uncharacterized protein n=1 Tax=Picea glauca TaxID=3330 RepID=A0A124GP13_PICGL|nr:hypothetical protein ABT39_MTgene386 [Picea glauca]QHR92209.1 hypothetical protein Q903MT_gene6246 [Picea sitchensis]
MQKILIPLSLMVERLRSSKPSFFSATRKAMVWGGSCNIANDNSYIKYSANKIRSHAYRRMEEMIRERSPLR